MLCVQRVARRHEVVVGCATDQPPRLMLQENLDVEAFASANRGERVLGQEHFARETAAEANARQAARQRAVAVQHLLTNGNLDAAGSEDQDELMQEAPAPAPPQAAMARATAQPQQRPVERRTLLPRQLPERPTPLARDGAFS